MIAPPFDEEGASLNVRATCACGATELVSIQVSRRLPTGSFRGARRWSCPGCGRAHTLRAHWLGDGHEVQVHAFS